MQADKVHDGAYLEKIYCRDLIAGMYVQELDRPWLETPFMFRGFCVRGDEEIEKLQKHCEYVYINRAYEEADPDIIKKRIRSNPSTISTIRKIATRPVSDESYPDTVIVESELLTAKVIHAEICNSIENIFSSAKSDGKFNLSAAGEITSAIVDSVMRNPDAFMLLQYITSIGRYRYNHAINCCALAANFCRHMGFSEADIHDISMGALMLDIGISRLPDALINTQGILNPLSMLLVRHHVTFGMEILDNTPDTPPVVRDMILTHHERINGKGYPNSIKAEQIPVCGRIAAIVDCYDAMTSNRPYKNRISQEEAVCAIYKWRNIDFHEDLVEQFIQCVGAYPTGSLVELNSGQIGIVMSQNRAHRLYPKILLVMNSGRTRCENPNTVDLWEYTQKTKGEILDINKSVNCDELGIDPSEYYL